MTMTTETAAVLQAEREAMRGIQGESEGEPSVSAGGLTVDKSGRLRAAFYTAYCNEHGWRGERWESLGDANMDCYDHMRGAHVLPPVQCAPWCEYGDGHPGKTDLESQVCTSKSLVVDLSLHEPVVDEDGTTWRHSVQCYAIRYPGESARINVGYDDGTEMQFIPAEARQLIEALQLVLGQIGAQR